MSVVFDVHVDGSELEQLIEGFRKRGERMGPIMAVVAEDLVTAVNDEFETAGRGNWAPLAASTIARRRKDGRGAQVLKDKGIFAGSIEAESGETHAEAATGVFYAVFHVSDEPRRIIPLRNPFDLPEDVFDTAEQTIVDMITERLAR